MALASGLAGISLDGTKGENDENHAPSSNLRGGSGSSESAKKIGGATRVPVKAEKGEKGIKDSTQKPDQKIWTLSDFDIGKPLGR
jgi:hypothetical protein